MSSGEYLHSISIIFKLVIVLYYYNFIKWVFYQKYPYRVGAVISIN